MKKVFALILLCAPMYIFAAGPPVFDTSHKNVFRKIVPVMVPQISVPTVFDLPVDALGSIDGSYILVESNQEIPIPSFLSTNRERVPIKLQTTDSLNRPVVARRASDRDVETYAAYDYEPQKDEKGRDIPAYVTIDVTAREAFETESLSFTFGKNVKTPRTIQISVVDESGQEVILVTERPFHSSHVTFPITAAKHFRIALSYNDHLRISEIEFHPKNLGQKTSQKIRFNATPQQNYKLYYDADRPVNIPTGEKPQLANVKNVQVAVLGETQKNPGYKRTDTDEDGIADAQDNCVTIANADQLDKDANAIGDACEDFDRDGLINAKDNCPSVTNRNQTDSDRDGIGDECDQIENRFVERYPWLPMATVISVGIFVAFLIANVLRTSSRQKK